MRNRQVVVVAVLLLVAVGTAIVLTGDDGGVTDEAAPTTTTAVTAAPTAGAHTVADPATTVPTPAASTTTAAPSAAATPSRVAITATTLVAATTTTVAARTTGSCGAGEATASFEPRDEVNTVAQSSFTPVVVVANHVNVDIVLEDVVLEVRFPTAAPVTVRFATSGRRIAPGGTATFAGERISGAEHYASFRFSRFSYEPKGQPGCLVTSP